MDTQQIFNKIKEENIKYEKNIVNRIMEGNENLKKTLAKIKKEMEKLSIHSNFNYDSLKNDYKKEKIFKKKENKNNQNIQIIHLNKIENKNEKKEKEKNEIKIENQIQEQNNLKFEIEQSSITEELFNNHNNKINNQNIITSIRSSHKRNKDSIDSFSRCKNKKTAVTSDSLSKSSANIIEKNNIKNVDNKNYKRVKNNSQPPKIKFIQANLNNVKLRNLDDKNKIALSKSPNIIINKKIKKKNLIPKNKSIGSPIIQSSKKKPINNISNIINNENEEQCKKLETLDSNKLYYDVDSENKIISKYNTLRSNKLNTNNSDINLDSNFNTININSNNNNFNNNNNQNNINSNSSNQNNNKYNYNSNNSNNNSSFLLNASRRAVYNSCSGSITRKEFYQNQNSLSNLNPSYSSNFFHISENSNANSKQNSNTISTKNSKKKKSFSQDNIKIKSDNTKDLKINEEKSENLDSIDSSILKNINNKSINYLKYNNDDIYEKKLFKNKINNAKKEYIKLKNEIIILKKKKDYLKKTIEEGEKTPFIPRPKTLKKFKSMNISKIKSRNNSAKNLKIEKDIYLDFKLKEEELLKKLNKIEEIPDIDPNNDILGKYVDKIIFRSMKKYKNRQCLKCFNFLSKGFSVKNCNKRHHIFREQYSK